MAFGSFFVLFLHFRFHPPLKHHPLSSVLLCQPPQIYKSHLAGSSNPSSNNRRPIIQPGGNGAVDSARANLAATYVNAFVNAGFGTDKLMTPEGNEWLYKNKDHGMLAASASLGSLLLWNVEEGLTEIDKFLYSNDLNVKAGAFLGVGVLSCGVRNDADPALALLIEHVTSEDKIMKVAAIEGLGIAYSGTCRNDVSELLVPIVEESEIGGDFLEVGLAGLSLGLINVGNGDDCSDVVSAMVTRLMECSDDELNFAVRVNIITDDRNL